MTDILCKWLNEEVHVSSEIDAKNFAAEFSSGFLLGEILNKHGLQADFGSFSKSSTADSKLNNFTRIEPTIALLNIPFDTNLAKDVMDEKPGVSTRLVYQLFIALGRKTKMNLTGVAMETMRPSAPAKLGEIETDIYKERLKTLVPRQVDLNFENLVKKYHGIQKQQEDEAFKANIEDADKLRKYQQKSREQNLQRSRQIRDKQEETMQKIKEATVKIPKPPESKKQGKNKDALLRDRMSQSVYSNINKFENSLKTMPPPMSPLDMDRSNVDTDINIFLQTKPSKSDNTATFAKQKPAIKDDYILKIRKQLDEDSKARKEREKRRRRVLVEQLKSHEAQQEAHREEMLVNRLMRQSQMERRIAVQLMHVRHEKEVIKRNRMAREQQFSERRLKDFTDSLEKEAELCRQAKHEYDNEVKENIKLHNTIVAEKAKQKYAKRYNICRDMLLEIVDFSCKVGEYRELTDKLLPPKLVREWKALFLEGKPLYQPEQLDVNDESVGIVGIDEDKELLLDEEDFKEYKQFSGEWKANRDTESQEPQDPPQDNVILGHILHRMFNIVSPPEPPPPAPLFPPCPLKICVIGKFFSGKSTAIQHLVATHRVVNINVDEIVEEALEAYKNKETIEEDTETPKGFEQDSAEDLSAKQSTINETEIEATIGKDESVVQFSTADKQADHSEQGISTAADSSESKQPDQTESKQPGSAKTESIKTIGSPQSFKSATSALIFTSRAKLGAKAFAMLKKGKPISDAIIVDIVVDTIRNVPDGTGWVLDGFPSTINQAKLLEKELTGYDAVASSSKTSSVSKKAKKSKLVPDPHPSNESYAVKSGLDLVCLFDLDDEIILRRAEGRTYDPTSADEFHQEFNPPPEGAYTGTMTQAKVQPVMDPSNDREQVQIRLSGFQDTLPKLEKWYGKFGVLHKLNADRPKDVLHEELVTVVEDLLQKMNAPQEEKGKELADIVEPEPAPKEEPPPEVQPELVPEAPPSPVSEAKSVKSGSKLAKPASPKGSKKGSKKDERSTSPGAKSKKKGRSPSADKKDDKTGKKAGRSPSPGKGSRSSSRSGSRSGSRGRKSPAKEPEVEVPPEPQGPPEPEPGSPEWEYITEPIDDELADILVDEWKNIEDSYVSNCKHVFRRVRIEREVIYRYMYNRRKDFAEFLKRPDAKQEFVSMWQKDYNEIAEDMRDDEDTKAEMYQRLDDLCERLWDICDTRKEEAEEERSNIIKEGWLEDHLGLLTNHHISLMQGEVDRYQATCKLLKDYYVGMEGGPGQKKAKVLPEESLSFSRIPLVELPVSLTPGTEPEPVLLETKPLSAKPSREREKETKTPDAEEDEGNKKRIPLVPRRPKSGDVTTTAKEIKAKKSTPRREKTVISEEKLDSPTPPADPDEKLLFDAFQAAVQAIENQNAADIAEEEAQAQRNAELEKEREKELMKIQSKEKKGKKGAGGGRRSQIKSGTSPGKSLITESPVPVPTEDNNELQKEEEEKEKKQKIREKSMKEYRFAITNEGAGLRRRLEVIKTQSTSVIQDLKTKADGSYKDMDDWLGNRFLNEMESIEVMTKIAREAIEKESKIQDAIILEDKEIVIDYDLKRFKTPSPPPPPSPKEEPKQDTFTVVELLALHEQFIEVSPTGLISTRAFCDTLMDLTTCTSGTEILPDSWTSITLTQLQDIASQLSVGSEYLDWKAFLLAAAKPWPAASIEGLLDSLRQFREIDHLKIGRVGREDFEKVQLWFSEEENDADSFASDGYNRLKELHSAFFDIFSDYNEENFSVDYLEMLLYFCATYDPLEGFLRALSLVTGSSLPPKEAFDVVTATSTHHEASSDQLEAVASEMYTPIKLEDLIRVFAHSKRIHGDSHRFSTTTDPLDSYSEERLSAICEELGGDENGVPIFLLFRHPIMRDCISMFKKFQSLDLQSALKSATEPQT
eukprot:gene7710-8548_t